MLELEAGHSHLYPGARGRIVAGEAANGPATLIFADGMRTDATLVDDHLHVAAHHTAKGTSIVEKSWVIEFADRSFRIRARASRSLSQCRPAR